MVLAAIITQQLQAHPRLTWTPALLPLPPPPVESRKRTQDKQDSVSDEECEPQKKAKKTVKLSKQEEQKAKAEEYETTLKEKHEGSYTRFQYKLWAEMLTAGVHNDINTPPAASMFSRENKRTQPKHTSNGVSSLGEAVSGMVGILTQALSPNLPPANRADKSGQYCLIPL